MCRLMSYRGMNWMKCWVYRDILDLRWEYSKSYDICTANMTSPRIYYKPLKMQPWKMKIIRYKMGWCYTEERFWYQIILAFASWFSRVSWYTSRRTCGNTKKYGEDCVSFPLAEIESWGYTVHPEVPSVQAGKSKQQSSTRFTTTFAHSHQGVEWHFNGICGRVAQITWKGSYYSSSWPCH